MSRRCCCGGVNVPCADGVNLTTICTTTLELRAIFPAGETYDWTIYDFDGPFTTLLSDEAVYQSGSLAPPPGHPADSVDWNFLLNCDPTGPTPGWVMQAGVTIIIGGTGTLQGYEAFSGAGSFNLGVAYIATPIMVNPLWPSQITFTLHCSIASGPGTALSKALAKLGVKPCGGCKKRAAWMDRAWKWIKEKL